MDRRVSKLERVKWNAQISDFRLDETPELSDCTYNILYGQNLQYFTLLIVYHQNLAVVLLYTVLLYSRYSSLTRKISSFVLFHSHARQSTSLPRSVLKRAFTRFYRKCPI